MQLVVLVFERCCGLYGEKSLFSVDCLFCNDCYVWSYWFSSIVVNSMRGGYSLLSNANFDAIVTSGRIGFREISCTF